MSEERSCENCGKDCSDKYEIAGYYFCVDCFNEEMLE